MYLLNIAKWTSPLTSNWETLNSAHAIKLEKSEELFVTSPKRPPINCTPWSHLDSKQAKAQNKE